MLFQLIELLVRDPGRFFRDPGTFVLVFGFFLAVIGVSLIVAITVHEFSHALVATLLGDNTARRRGRLTLNPLSHLDPMGTLLIFLVGFGWGKPTPVNPHALRTGPRAGMTQVSLAGPMSNLLTAALFALPFRMGWVSWGAPPSLALVMPLSPSMLLGNLLTFLILYNILLAVFNLIPLAPLDGFKVVLGLLPRDLALQFARLERWGPALLLTIIAVDSLSSTGILWRIIGPATNLVSQVLLQRPML